MSVDVSGRGPARARSDGGGKPRSDDLPARRRGFREALGSLRPPRGPHVEGPRASAPPGPAPPAIASARATPPLEAKAEDPPRLRERPSPLDDERARGLEARPEADPLDPHARHVAQLAPPASFPAAPPTTHAEPTARAARSLEELVPELVRRIAWAGDGRRGTVRMELGAGSFAGASVLVHADDGRVRIELGGLPEHALGPLRERLSARLQARGFDLESVT